jgi:hypothetical protein
MEKVVMSVNKPEERTVQDFTAAAQTVYNQHFQLTRTDADQLNITWNDWLHLEKRTLADLIGLLNDPDNSAPTNGQALVALLSPSTSLSPFSWTGQYSRYNDLVWAFRKLKFAELSDNLQQLTFKLLPACLQAAYDAHALRHKEIEDNLPTYKDLVVFALEVLPEDDPLAEMLFNNWQPLDPVTYWNRYHQCGLGDFSALLKAPVPNSWKLQADKILQAIVGAEHEGRTYPKDEHLKASRQYLDLVQCILFEDTLPYELDQLALQIEFIVGLSDNNNVYNFHNEVVYIILELLTGGKYLELRRGFAQHVVSNQSEKFAQAVWKAAKVEEPSRPHNNLPLGLAKTISYSKKRLAAKPKQSKPK